MSCAVPGCTNNRRFKPDGVSFHRFPQDELLEEWLHALRKDPIKSWIWSKNKFVCSLHFRPEDFIVVGNKRMVKINAVPSILPSRKVRYGIEQAEQCRTVQNYAEQASKDTSAESSLVRFVIKPSPLINAASVPSVLESGECFVEHVSKSATIKPTTSEDFASNSSVVHYVIKSHSSSRENTLESSNGKQNKIGIQWESMTYPKPCTTRFGDLKATDSHHLGDDSIILPSILPCNSQGATSKSTTGGKNIFTSDLNKYHIVNVSKPKHSVHVNAKEANWKMNNVEKLGKTNDPLALEAYNSTTSLVQPKRKRTANNIKIKVVKQILRRKLRTVDVAVATSPTRNELKANANMKRLTGLSLPFFTELLSFLQEVHPNGRKKLYGTKRLLLFLIKMKRGISFTSLASFFKLNPYSVSRIFTDVLDILYSISQQWLVVCAKSTKRSTGPCSRFKVMIDCFEVLIEYPYFLQGKEVNFYSTNTQRYSYKFLLGVAPTGSVSFVSKAQGGNVSKATTFKNTCSSWLSCIQAGDLVAIGRGCPELASVLEERGAVPVPFSFKKGGPVELEELAACRRRFERTVQKLKRFEILKLITSESSGQKRFEVLSLHTPQFFNQVDKIVHTCCVLLNHKLLKPNRQNK